MFPRKAFREILLNAVIHKDYGSNNPIQISVYDDKMYIWNNGTMPEELASAENLFEKHSSIPFNPKLAGVFFKSGMVETWGRGFEKIKEACDEHGTPLPEYKISSNGVMVLCKPNEFYMSLRHEYGTNGTINDPVNDPVNDLVNKTQLNILNALKDNNAATYEQLAFAVGVSSSTIKRNLKKLQELSLIKRTGSDKTGCWEILK